MVVLSLAIVDDNYQLGEEWVGGGGEEKGGGEKMRGGQISRNVET
jgi:hypothetical protein